MESPIRSETGVPHAQEKSLHLSKAGFDEQIGELLIASGDIGTDLDIDKLKGGYCLADERAIAEGYA